MPATTSNSEWLTRKKIIDQKLRACGWKLFPFKGGQPIAAYEGCAVEKFETDHGPADYGLCRGGQFIGVAEASKRTISPQKVLSQAERYVKGITYGSRSFWPNGAIPLAAQRPMLSQWVTGVALEESDRRGK